MWWEEAATMSSFIQVGPKIAHTGQEAKDGEHCNVLLHSSTAGREADEHRRVVGRGGGGKVLFHSSGTALCTAALLDERLGSTAGQAAARSSFVQVGPKLRTLDEKLRMASTAKPTSN